MKLDKKDIRNIILLIIVFLGFVFFLTRFKFLYGSTVDWQTQHVAIAEYFRNSFYENFDLFPSFDFHMGAGQNIYNFSYYGFLNPIILVSYFFPFLEMVTYIIISSILGVIASIILFYKWLRNHGTSSKLTFLTTFLFLCSGPLIFHSHRHIMFVNYMPFLLLALMSIDTYFKSGKRVGLIISTFFIIMSSYYYSIPSLIVLVIYGIYVFLKKYDKITVKLFFQEGFRFLFPIVVAIMMAGILLLPTMYTILNGRSMKTLDISIGELLMPKMNINYFLYGHYAIGLTAIAVFALVYALISRKKERIFMGTIISLFIIFPVFVYGLNGFLYENAKVLIPFLPICCYLISLFFHDLFQNKVKIKKTLLIVLVISVIAFFTVNFSGMKIYSYKVLGFLIKFNHLHIYLVEIFIISLMILLWHYKRIKIGLIVSVVVITFAVTLRLNMTDSLVSLKKYENTFSKDITTLYDEILPKEKNIYRSSNLVDLLVTSNRVYNSDYYNTSIFSSVYNPIYRDFYVDTFSNALSQRNYLMLTQTNNILWDTYMGIKYVVSTSTPTVGYKKILEKGKYKIYENDYVLPIGYANSKLMSKEEFENLGYPYKLEALLHYTIVENAPKSDYETKIKEYKLDYSNVDTKNLKITEKDGTYTIVASEKTTIQIPLKEKLDNKVLLLKFNMNYEPDCSSNSSGYTSITINKIKNVLSCDSWQYKNQNKVFEYSIANPSIEKLEVEFNVGTFVIDGMEAYLLDYNDVKKSLDHIDTFYFDKKKTKEDSIEGTIKVQEDGYFSLSIPYDKGFNVYVNDKKVNYEQVNTAFIGFPLSKGDYKIKIVYTAPLKNLGGIVSVVGFVLFLIVGVIDYKKEIPKKKITKKEA